MVQEGSPRADTQYQLGMSDLVLSGLATYPDIFASIINETGLGNFVPLSDAFLMTPGQVNSVLIDNPNYFFTLIFRVHIDPSSEIIRFRLIKDNIPVMNVAGFSEFDALAPNTYTPIRNTGALEFTNLSAISTPSVSYYVETLQIPTNNWVRLRTLLGLQISQALDSTTEQNQRVF